MSACTSVAPDARSHAASSATSAGQRAANETQAATVASRSITSAPCCARPTSVTSGRTVAPSPSNRKAGAAVTTVIARSGRSGRSADSTSAVRVAWPNPWPET